MVRVQYRYFNIENLRETVGIEGDLNHDFPFSNDILRDTLGTGANDNHSEFENLRVDVGTGGDLNDDYLSRNYFSIHVNDQSLLN